MGSRAVQFEFEWLELAINCSEWAISLQVGMRTLKAAAAAQTEDHTDTTVRVTIYHTKQIHFGLDHKE